RLRRDPSLQFPAHPLPSARTRPLPAPRIQYRHRARTTRQVVLSQCSIQAILVQQLLFVAPVFFDFHKQLEMTTMAQQLFDLAARANADVFQTTRALADDDLLLRPSLDYDH